MRERGLKNSAVSFNVLGTFSTMEADPVCMRKSVLFQHSETFPTFSKILHHTFLKKVPPCFHWRVPLINQCQSVACGFCK